MSEHEYSSARGCYQSVHFLHSLEDHTPAHFFLVYPIAIYALYYRIAELAVKIPCYLLPFGVALLRKRQPQVFLRDPSPVPRYIVDHRVEDVIRYPVMHA